MKALSINDIAVAVKGRLNNYSIGQKLIHGVSFDTREDMGKKLFIPLKGSHFDGHSFIADALELGAICVLSEKDTEFNAIIVEDTRAALMELAAYYRQLFDIKVVAITGSNGKTSTKDMMASVLSQKYNVVKTIGNFNNDIGLPTTIFNIDDSTEVLVLEMGMNHRHEIHHLSRVAKPDFAVITNIGFAHIENLGSQEEIFKAKSEILDFLAKDGKFFVCGDDDFLLRFRENPAAVFFGTSPNNAFRAVDIQLNYIDSGSYNLIKKDGKSYSIYVPSGGLHMIKNSLAACAVGEYMGLNNTEIARGIQNFKPSGSRMAIIETDYGMKIIDDCYNSSPDSVSAALDTLVLSKGSTMAILGDMLELGNKSHNLHFEIGKEAARHCIDTIICIGEHSQTTYEGAYEQIRKDASNSQIYYFSNKRECIDRLASMLKPGDTILVKASRGMKFEDIVNYLKEL